MYIISKFHDYYDVGMNSGVDKTIIYERNTSIVEGKFPDTQYAISSWHPGVVAFCGKFYPFLYRVVDYKVCDFAWTLEEALATLTVADGGKRRYRYWDEYEITTEVGIKNFFGKKYPELEDLFHKHRTPVFVFKPVLRTYSWSKPKKYNSLVLNPSLKDLEFYKVKGPIEAFQDIAMYMSGVIGAPPKQLVQVSDKVKAASRGHDGEYSFKKPPGKRGKNKWR